MLGVMKDVNGGVRLAERELRPCPPGYARVAVTAGGVCGTDLHLAAGEYRCEPPVTMGHEISGTVAEVGSEADAAWLGRRVVCETYFATCGACAWCRDGRRNLCPERRSLGSFEDGGFAESVVVPILNLHRLPEGIDPVAAVLAEPLACVTQCLFDPATVTPGDRVLVIGPGAVGLLAVMVAVAAGGDVTCAGLPQDAPRLALAAERGAATTTDRPDEESFDVVVECSGTAGGVVTALRAATRGGRVVQVGIVGRDVEVPYDLVLYRELTVTSGFASTARSWRRAMALLRAGSVRLDGLVSHRYALADWREAFAMVGDPGALKVVLVPGDPGDPGGAG